MATWQELSVSDRRMLFERLLRRTDSRAHEATEWRRHFGKILVTSNLTAMGVSLAFITNIYTKQGSLDSKFLTYLVSVSFVFLTGFIVSVVFNDRLYPSFSI